MSERFGDAASDWIALSARLLGWRPTDFWSATPAELFAALKDPIDTAVAPSRQQISDMMERDQDG